MRSASLFLSSAPRAAFPVFEKRRLPSPIVAFIFGMILGLSGCETNPTEGPGANYVPWLFTTNNFGSGQMGVRITLGYAPVGAFPAVPCASAVDPIDWSPLGASLGIAKNRRYRGMQRLWVSISSQANLGAAWYDVPTAPVPPAISGREYHPGGRTGVPADIAGAGTNPVVLGKQTLGTINQWTLGTVAEWTYTPWPHPSQIEWLFNNYYVTTIAGFSGTNCGCFGAGCRGRVGIGELSHGGALPPATAAALVNDVGVPLPIGTIGQHTKPEGVDVARLQGAAPGCAAGATHAVYVTDWCQSHLHVYSVDSAAVPPALTHESAIDLDVAAGLPADCKPSSVRYHRPTRNVFVICQTSGSIIRLNAAANQCLPTWNAEQPLQRAQNPAATASCATPAPPVINCGASCQPHDIAYGPIVPNWLFVNLTRLGQVVTIDSTNIANQFVVYVDNTNYQPLELELVRARK